MSFILMMLAVVGTETRTVAHDCVACMSIDLYREFYTHCAPGARPLDNYPYSFRIRRGLRVRILERGDRFRPPWFRVAIEDGRYGVIRQDDVAEPRVVYQENADTEWQGGSVRCRGTCGFSLRPAVSRPLLAP